MNKAKIIGKLFKRANRLLVARKEISMLMAYYRPFSFGKPKKNVYMFMADGHSMAKGLFDRYKGIISIYAMSKVYGKPFRIHFVEPFELREYLEPNRYDWYVDKEHVTYSYPSSRPVLANRDYISPLYKKHAGEVHFYLDQDMLEDINRKFDTNYQWADLYGELFRPAPRLQEQIDRYKAEIGQRYIAIHIRFLNLIGDKTEPYPGLQKTLEPLAQNALKESCLAMIDRLQGENPGCRVLLATDSNLFVEHVKANRPEVYIIPGEIKHSDSKEMGDASVLKVFLDYYLIAEAAKVFSIVGGGLYHSAFPQYSAKIGGIPFQRVSLDLK